MSGMDLDTVAASLVPAKVEDESEPPRKVVCLAKFMRPEQVDLVQ